MRPAKYVPLLLLLLLSSLAHGQMIDKIDWPGFMARHDMVWNRVPEDWNHGAFQGNGQLGANIYAEGDNTVAWHIGRTDVVYGDARIPIGNLVLHTVGKIQSCTMRLGLWNAQITGTVTTDAGSIQFRSFTHSDQMVQVIQLAATGGESQYKFDWAPGQAADPRSVMKHEPIPPDKVNPDPVLSDDGDVHLCSQGLKTGGGDVTAWKQVTLPNQQTMVLLAVGYSTQSLDTAKSEAENDLTKAQTTGLANLLATHRQWWHNYYPESFVSFPDTRLESFYWIQMYKLASATRADRPAIDLMGPWFNRTPWPKIWWNLNIQLTYWPVLTSNRLELGESLCKMLDKGAPNLATNAGQFSADSDTIGHSSSYDCVQQGGDELCDLPWVMHNYYLQYRYSMDDDMLRNRLFPLLKRTINFYFHQLQQGPDGKLHIMRGYSPEYPKQPTPNPDCNIDLSLLRWGCMTLLDICQRLNIDDPLIPKWKDTLQNLTPYPTNQDGLMISASVPFAESHRHYSHLLMVYPLYIMNLEQPENRDLVIKSLNHWMGMPKALQGYSYTGAASISALLHKGDDAAGYLNKLLDTKIHPNTMYTEAGPVIETPLSAAASVHDMLLSSWGDKIRVFPGAPNAWKDITFYHFRAQGAFLVSAVRKDGKTQFVNVQSLAGEPCRVWSDMQNPVADGNVPVRNLGDGVVEVGLKKGESVTLYPQGTQPDLTDRRRGPAGG